MADKPRYHNLISSIDIDRDINSIVYFDFSLADYKVKEFMADINKGNDIIELNLIKTNSYKEALILSLKKPSSNSLLWKNLLKEEQKTFSGSKLFYLNQEFDKILILSIPGNTEGKIKMVINRLNRVNEKINRINLKIKKENLDTFQERIKTNDKKDKIINLINLNLRT